MKVTIGGVEVKAIVDTGSQVTTVTEEFYNKYVKRQEP
jgi:Aspartyl protease